MSHFRVQITAFRSDGTTFGRITSGVLNKVGDKEQAINEARKWWTDNFVGMHKEVRVISEDKEVFYYSNYEMTIARNKKVVVSYKKK